MDTLEANLVQQLTRITHKPLFQLFLDVCKAYDSLDWGGSVNIEEIRAGYKPGPPTQELLEAV